MRYANWLSPLIAAKDGRQLVLELQSQAVSASALHFLSCLAWFSVSPSNTTDIYKRVLISWAVQMQMPP